MSLQLLIFLHYMDYDSITEVLWHAPQLTWRCDAAGVFTDAILIVYVDEGGS